MSTGGEISTEPVMVAAYDRVCAACKNSGVHMGISTGCPITVSEIMARVDNRGWVHIGADLALLVGAVDALFDGVKAGIKPVPKVPKPRL